MFNDPAHKPSRVFVVTVGNQALVAFEAISMAEALQLPKESWFLEELVEPRRGKPAVWSREGKLRVRAATTQEACDYRTALSSAPAAQKQDLFLAYLV
jgi:hypothetical protein